MVDEYFAAGARESSDSFLIDHDVPAKKKERRTFIDIKTNDATLFNLGYTARVTQAIPQDKVDRKTSLAHFGLPHSLSHLAPQLSQVVSAVDSAKVSGSFNASDNDPTEVLL